MNRKQRRELEKERRSASKINRNKDRNLELKNPELGPSGTYGELFTVPVFPNDLISSEDKLGDTQPRDFDITVFLNRDFIFSNEIQMTKANDAGSSFLVLPNNALYMKVHTNGVEFAFHKNRRSEASAIKGRINSKTRGEAVEKFIDMISPTLDHLSYKHNRPIFYEEVHVFDIKHQINSINYVSPYSNFSIESPGGIFNELIPIHSLYREAKNSVSPFYKIMCYSKIMEGLIASVRPKIGVKAKELSIALNFEKTLVPADPELEKFYPQHIGRPIVKLYQEDFQKTFRDAMAHFALDGKEPLNLSSYKDRSNFSSNVHLLELCCRVLIDDTNRLLTDLNIKASQ